MEKIRVPKKSVLFVTGEKSIRETIFVFLRAYFESRPRFREAISGKEALKKIMAGFIPDVIVVDYKASPINGLQMLDTIVKMPHLFSVCKIMISHQSSTKSGQRLGEQAAKRNCHFFPMPVYASVLYELIKKETGSG
jgi:CheY-like chemotaxis protein